MSEKKLEKKFGQSPVFVASTLLENGGTLKIASPASLLKEAIHVISCGYEDKTEWGKEVHTMFWSFVQILSFRLLKVLFKFDGANLFFTSRLAGYMAQLQRIS